MTADTFDGFIFPVELPARVEVKKPKRQLSLILLGLSLLVHLVVFFALSLGSHQDHDTLPKPEPVRATLIFAPTTQAVDSPQPELSEPIDTVPVDATRAEDVELSEPFVEETVTPPVPQTTPEPVKSSSTPAPTQSEIITTTKDVGQKTIKQQPINTSARQALQNFMQSARDSALQQDSEHAAQEYRRLKTSPELPKRDLAQEALKRTQLKPKEVNCDSGVNKTLTMISGLTGGMLKCTERSNHLERYINKRVNKGVEEDQ